MNSYQRGRSQEMVLKNEADIIFARMQVRQLASDAGLALGNQARISLATSSLAHELNIGKGCRGQIEVSCLNENGTQGIRVSCTVDNGFSQDRASKAAASVKWLVDELSVSGLQPDGKVQVTLIQWKA
jgi:anti-sigma regulatory factor (Ser/Thr protein kinase)